MKNIENQDLWKIALEVFNEITFEEYGELERSSEEIKEDCHSLAVYSYEKDVEKGTITEHELQAMEIKGEIFNSHIFIRLAKHFYLEEIVEGKNVSRARTLAETIHAFLGNQYYYKLDSYILKKLCILGKQFPKEYNNYIHIDRFIVRMAESAVYLKNQGINISVKEGSIEIKDDMEQQLFNTLDGKIAAISGNYVLERVFKEYIGNRYIPMMDRYFISRNADDERNEPLNILINLSAKHLKNNVKRTISHEREKLIDEVIKFDEAWLDICNIQGESGMEYSMISSSHFPIYLKNEMIFDKMCIPMQYSAKYIIKSLDYLVKPWFDKYANKKYTYSDYRKFAEYILNLSSWGGYLNIQDLKMKTQMASYKIQLIIKDISLLSTKVNYEFNSLDGRVN